MDVSTINVRTAAGATAAQLSVQVIGPFRVRRGSRALTSKELGGPRQRRILEILLLQLGTPVSKQRLVDLLWGADAPAAALANLESYVSVLRRHLQPGQGKNGPLKTTNGGYVIDASMVDLDLSRFERLLDTAMRSSARQADVLLHGALDMASGSLLENERDCEWIDSRRGAFASRVTEARLLLAEADLELGRYEETVVQARKVLATDPLNERAWNAIVLGLEGAGRSVEGLQAYEQCRRTLDHELGCAPSGMLQSAYTRMLRATAATGSELGQALTALLVLHDQLGDTDWGLGTRAPLARHEAASVLQSFVGRSLSTAA